MNFAFVAASVTVQAEQVRAFSKTLCIEPAWGTFTESPFCKGKTRSAPTAEPPFQQHPFPQPRALTAASAGSPNEWAAEPRASGTVALPRHWQRGTLGQAEQKGCAPQQRSCPCSCSHLSLSQQLSTARLDTEGKGTQTPFVKLIPDILP